MISNGEIEMSNVSNIRTVTKTLAGAIVATIILLLQDAMAIVIEEIIVTAQQRVCSW